MEYTTYASRLQYLDASDVDGTVVDYDGLDVHGPDGTRIGELDGFIVDAAACKLHYAVIDSGGWFRSRRFLVPVGHATVAADHGALRLDVSKDALLQYPEFDEGQFPQFTDDDLRVFERRMSEACCPDATSDDEAREYGAHPHFAQPEWWTRTSYPHERLRPVEVAAFERTGPRRTAQRIPFVEDTLTQSER